MVTKIGLFLNTEIQRCRVLSGLKQIFGDSCLCVLLNEKVFVFLCDVYSGKFVPLQFKNER